MPQYRNLEKMYKDFKKSVTQIIGEVVPPVMKDKMSEAVEIEVYARYSPTMYIRRENDGGLSDIRNMVHDIEIKGNQIIITLYNLTTGNRMYDGYDNELGCIGSIVASGKGYTWRRSDIFRKQPYPRDFYEVTNVLMNSDEVRNLIINKLKDKGLIVR